MEKIVKVTPDYIKNIISEEREIILEHRRYKKMLMREAQRMHHDGCDPQVINEGLIDLIKSLGGQFIKSIKHDIAEWVLRKLGFSTGKWGWRVVTNLFEEMDILSLRKYFGPEGCEELTELILLAIGETGVEGPVNGFIDGMGIETTGRMYVVVREELTDLIMKGEVAQKISDTISEIICNIEISSIADAIAGDESELLQDLTGIESGEDSAEL